MDEMNKNFELELSELIHTQNKLDALAVQSREASEMMNFNTAEGGKTMDPQQYGIMKELIQ